MIYSTVIYQIDKNNKEAKTKLFAGWNKNESRFDFSDYTKSYNLSFEESTVFSPETVVRKIIEMFNSSIGYTMPEDFPEDMHLVTTSDVIKFQGRYYFISLSKIIDVTERI